jgi:folate-dependent phosphoribosylglycinamide formyltransferase PurN
MHDSDQRLQAFVTEMNEKDVDFIVQLGYNETLSEKISPRITSRELEF